MLCGPLRDRGPDGLCVECGEPFPCPTVLRRAPEARSGHLAAPGGFRPAYRRGAARSSAIHFRTECRGRRSGRPSREARLFTALRAGNTRAAAPAYAGITDRTLRYWVEQSSVFSDALTRAEQEAEVALVANIRMAGQTDWRAHAWLLERRNPAGSAT
jgi:hypothetical protein